MYEHICVCMCAASATMDIDDLMKETFSAILVDAKLERSVVIQVHKHEYVLGKISD